MIALTEPQVWTLIGVFSAVFIGMLTVVQTSFVRVLRTEIGSVRTEIGSVRTELRTEIGGVHREIASLRSELKSDMVALEARMDTKFAALDRDVQTLMRREWDGGQS